MSSFILLDVNKLLRSDFFLGGFKSRHKKQYKFANDMFFFRMEFKHIEDKKYLTNGKVKNFY